MWHLRVRRMVLFLRYSPGFKNRYFCCALRFVPHVKNINSVRACVPPPPRNLASWFAQNIPDHYLDLISKPPHVDIGKGSTWQVLWYTVFARRSSCPSFSFHNHLAKRDGLALPTLGIRRVSRPLCQSS